MPKTITPAVADALLDEADAHPDLPADVAMEEGWAVWRVAVAGCGYAAGDLVLADPPGVDFYSSRLGWTTAPPVAMTAVTITETEDAR